MNTSDFWRLAAGVCLIAGLLNSHAHAEAPAAPADLVLRDAEIYTVDAMRSWAQAVAVRDGLIDYVGTDAGVEAYIGPDTRVIDVADRMVLPGLQDAHVHPISGGMEALACSLNGLGSQEEYLAAVRAYAQSHPEVPWILGGGWSMAVFGPGARPSRKLLDAIESQRPIYLSSQDGHTAWVNTRALEIAGITRETPQPVDGIIDHDPDSGEPVGSLQEGAMALVEKHIPAPSLETRAAGLRYTLKMLNGFGITAFQDASVRPPDLEAYRYLDERGDLTARVVASLWWERGEGEAQIPRLIRERQRFTGGRLRATTVKIMQDGVMENFTAVMLEPYLGKDGMRGIPMVDPGELKRIVTRLDAEGFQVHFHAIGDGAIRQSLDAVEAARSANGALGHRHHIAHLELIDPQDIPRFQALDVVANFQPLWAYADDYITDLTIPFIGPKRARWIYPIASVLHTGAVVAFGSDWSVSSANPFEQIETAVTRMGALGETETPFISEERIDLAPAIAAFTINAAYVNHLEAQTGSIEVGKSADLVVLDRNLFRIDPTALSDTRVLLTLLEGEPVYGDLSLTQP